MHGLLQEITTRLQSNPAQFVKVDDLAERYSQGAVKMALEKNNRDAPTAKVLWSIMKFQRDKFRRP